MIDKFARSWPRFRRRGPRSRVVLRWSLDLEASPFPFTRLGLVAVLDNSNASLIHPPILPQPPLHTIPTPLSCVLPVTRVYLINGKPNQWY